MSLLEIRRERRDSQMGPNRPPRMWKLMLGLCIVFALIWYLRQF